MLSGRYSDAIGRELFTAVGEATLLAAWMSYYSAPASALAQGYFVQALALAQAGHDRLLGASILDAMSHQATFLGRFNEAANLARAALAGTGGIATPTLWDCALFCTFHHQVVIHRWGWTVVLNPDGTTTAWNKDKTKILRSHSPPAQTG